MTLLGELIRPRAELSRPPALRPSLLGTLVSGSAIGVAMTGGGSISDEERALRYTTLKACIDLIAGTVSTLPIRLVHRGDRERREVRTPELRHVWGRPNVASGHISFWEARLASLLLWGNSYNFKGRENGNGQVAALWGIHPSRVEPKQRPNLTKVYRVDADDNQIYDAESIQQIMAMSTDEVKGYSPLNLHAQAIGLGLTEERYGATWFNSPGSNLAAVVALPAGLEWDKDKAADFRQDWESTYSGRDHPVGFLTEGATYTKIGVPPNEAQFLESRNFQRDEIASIYRVPPTLIGLVQKTSAWGKGVEQLTIAFITYALLQWIARIEESIDDELLPDDVQAKLIVSGLLRGDSQARWQTYMWARTNGILSRDDIREFEDLPPAGIPDDFLSPKNMDRLLIGKTGADASIIREMSSAIAAHIAQEPIAASVEETLIRDARCPTDGKKLGVNHPANVALYCRGCKSEVLPVEGA